MMPTYDASDIVELKNRKKRQKRLVKLLIFILVAAVIYGLYHYRNEWLPKLQGIGKQYKTIINDGRLAEGNFPLEINESSEYQLKYSDDTLFMLCDAYIYYYNTNGGLIKKRQHAYTNSVLSVAGGNALIFESGGNELTVENEDSVMYTKTLDDSIMFARLSSDGYAAVVTTSGNYACELTVYDDKGKSIYERKCVDRVNDISFTEDSKGCIISYVDAENGSLVTTVQKLAFSKSGEVWSSPAVETLGLETYGYSNGAFVLGITACAYVDSDGQISSYYRYDGDFAGGSSRGGKSAVIINDDERREYTLALFEGGGKEPVLIELDSPLKDVEVYDGLAYVMSQKEIRAYDFDGAFRSTAEISDLYDSFRRSDDYIFLMGHNKVDRIDYNS